MSIIMEVKIGDHEGKKKNVKDALHKGVHMKNRIEEIRKVRGINQEELAKVLGVSRQTISSLENGRYNPSIELAISCRNISG